MIANTGSQASRSATQRPLVGAVSRPGTRPASRPTELAVTNAGRRVAADQEEHVLVYGLCLYAVTVRCRPWIVVGAAGVTVAGAGFIDPGSTPSAVFLTAIAVLLGVVIRVRRSGERQLEEQERRHSGERALLEERQRIARELHDVVAHHMSVIAIQAEAAPYKTADPPPELVESFGEIGASALAGPGRHRHASRRGRQPADRNRPRPAPGPATVRAEAGLGGGRAGRGRVRADRADPGHPAPA